MLKSCSHCGGIHKRGVSCPSKPAKQKKTTYIDRFRKTRTWRKKREQICERDKYLCQVCIRELYNTQQKYTFDGIQVHHIIPIAKAWELRLEDSNLISLCTYHHKLAEVGKIPIDVLKNIVDEQSPPSFF